MASLIRSELARVFVEEVSDPRLREVVITNVELSKDLKSAKVFFAPPSKDPKDIDRGLVRACPFFRRRLGENLELRYVPTLEFRADTHGERVDRLLHLLDELERDPSA